MKRILILIIPLIFTASCEEETFILSEEDMNFVHFLKPALTTSESVPVTLDIIRSTSEPEKELTIHYSVSGIYSADSSDASQTVNIGEMDNPTSEAGKAVLKAGAHSVILSLVPVNDLIATGNRTFTITIEDVSGAECFIGYPGTASQKEMRVIINEDDCPWEIESAYNVFGGATTITPDPEDPNKYTTGKVAVGWNLPLVVSRETGTITIPETTQVVGGRGGGTYLFSGSGIVLQCGTDHLPPGTLQIELDFTNLNTNFSNTLELIFEPLD